MRERQCGIGREGAQDVSGGLVMQVVETAPQGLPIQGDHAQALPSSPVVQATSVATEDSLQFGWVERQDEIAQGVESRCAKPLKLHVNSMKRPGVCVRFVPVSRLCLSH